ncbi:MAG: hypothetical protein OER86_14165, partial [Phycisphaerae bacterium]|nr:hypothetical protein [Phycisphaerae bacterium]
MKDQLDRRDFLVQGLGALGSLALVGGCHSGPPAGAFSPRTPWPPLGPLPRPSGSNAYVPTPRPSTPTPRPTPPVVRAPAGSVGNPIPRTNWARYGPSPLEINPMRGVNRITIHHEGTPDAVYFSDPRTTAKRLESIRRGHRGRGWSDIGYHYVVDRAG